VEDDAASGLSEVSLSALHVESCWPMEFSISSQLPLALLAAVGGLWTMLKRSHESHQPTTRSRKKFLGAWANGCLVR
jgi:hypothetical protein